MLCGRCFNIKTSLPKEEVIKILKRETIPYKGNSIFIKVSDFIFWKGKFDNEKFLCMPLPQKVPFYGNMNSFLPMIKGEVLEKEGTEIKVEVSGTWIYLIFLICINFFLLIGLFSKPVEWKGILIIVGMDIFIVIYFHIVVAKVKVLFEELFCF